MLLSHFWYRDHGTTRWYVVAREMTAADLETGGISGPGWQKCVITNCSFGVKVCSLAPDPYSAKVFTLMPWHYGLYPYG